MKPLTLDGFIQARLCVGGLWVKEKGFKGLYVRIGNHCFDLDGKRITLTTLDLANMEVCVPGQGTFTRLVQRLRRDYPHLPIYVESVFEERFRKKLERMGFKCVGLCHDCFVLGV